MIVNHKTNPNDVKHNAILAWRYAKARLTWLEGHGHEIQLDRPLSKDGFICSFAKPSWPGDHCGDLMPTGAEAIINAVQSYERELL